MRQHIWFHFESGKDDKHILDVTEISVRQLRKMRRNWEKSGEVVKPHLASGRPKKLNRTHHFLPQYLEQRPTAFQDEMSWFLWDEFQLVVVESTISRALKQLGWNRKKKAIRIAKQRNQSLRDEMDDKARGWRAKQLVFLDESVACERTGM